MTYRILMLSSIALAAPWNGADKNLARLLVQSDSNNQFIVQTGIDEAWPSHVGAVRLRGTSPIPTNREKLRGFSYLLRHTRDVDLVHVVASLSNPSPWTARLVHDWLAACRKPLVHTIPSIGDIPIKHQNFAGDITVVVSEHTRQLLTSHGVPNVVRIFPPLDERHLHPSTSATELAQRLAIGPRAVLYPAHYGPQSGISEIIRAFAQLPATLHDAVLVLACRTQPGQDSAREAQHAMAFAATAGIADRVRVIDHVSDMPALIMACMVMALVPGKLASKMDLPLVVLEALVLERPVIISDKPPMSEALFGGGFAVRHGDVPALTAALAQLLLDSNLRAKLAAQGRAAVLQQCHPVRVVDRYKQIYQSAFEGHRELARKLL